jgi:hypothetical protein
MHNRYCDTSYLQFRCRYTTCWDDFGSKNLLPLTFFFVIELKGDPPNATMVCRETKEAVKGSSVGTKDNMMLEST